MDKRLFLIIAGDFVKTSGMDKANFALADYLARKGKEVHLCAKPVVTTEITTGTSFACEHGITGLVVPPKDPEALRDAINKILSDPEYAKKLGEEGRRRQEDNFTLEKMGEAFLRLYKRVLDQDEKDI